MTAFENAMDALNEMVENGWELRKAINEVIIAFHKVLTPDESQSIWNLLKERV